MDIDCWYITDSPTNNFYTSQSQQSLTPLFLLHHQNKSPMLPVLPVLPCTRVWYARIGENKRGTSWYDHSVSQVPSASDMWQGNHWNCENLIQLCVIYLTWHLHIISYFVLKLIWYLNFVMIWQSHTKNKQFISVVWSFSVCQNYQLLYEYYSSQLQDQLQHNTMEKFQLHINHASTTRHYIYGIGINSFRMKISSFKKVLPTECLNIPNSPIWWDFQHIGLRFAMYNHNI